MKMKELGKWLQEWKTGSWTGIHHRSIEGQMMLALLTLLERAYDSLDAEGLVYTSPKRKVLLADLRTVLEKDS